MSYTDDATVLDGTLLLRRVPDDPGRQLVWDGNQQRWRPSSAAFNDDRRGDPMSVTLEDTLRELGRPLESALDGHEEGYFLAAITALLARQNNQGIQRDPLREEPAHGLVFGKKSKAVRSRLAKGAAWVVAPKLDPPTSGS